MCAAKLSAHRSSLPPAARSAAALVTKSSAAHRSCSTLALSNRSATDAYTRNLAPSRSPVSGSVLDTEERRHLPFADRFARHPELDSRCAPSHQPSASPARTPART